METSVAAPNERGDSPIESSFSGFRGTADECDRGSDARLGTSAARHASIMNSCGPVGPRCEGEGASRTPGQTCIETLQYLRETHHPVSCAAATCFLTRRHGHAGVDSSGSSDPLTSSGLSAGWASEPIAIAGRRPLLLRRSTHRAILMKAWARSGRRRPWAAVIPKSESARRFRVLRPAWG